MLIKIVVCLIAGIGAGLGIGFVSMTATAVITPMLMSFLGMAPYQAISVSLACDAVASAVGAMTYRKSGNIDMKNGLFMMGVVLAFTLVGSWLSKLAPSSMLGGSSVITTFIFAAKFLIWPVKNTENTQKVNSRQSRMLKILVFGILIGWICGFFGAGGGVMILLVLTSLLGYELKTAVGTSLLIMAASALTGAIGHFVIGGMPELLVLALCVLSTTVAARMAAKYANQADPLTLNRMAGGFLLALGIVIVVIQKIST